MFDVGFLVMKDFYAYIRKYNEEVERGKTSGSAHFVAFTQFESSSSLSDQLPSQ